jgi:hypothetical protein
VNKPRECIKMLPMKGALDAGLALGIVMDVLRERHECRPPNVPTPAPDKAKGPTRK